MEQISKIIDNQNFWVNRNESGGELTGVSILNSNLVEDNLIPTDIVSINSINNLSDQEESLEGQEHRELESLNSYREDLSTKIITEIVHDYKDIEESLGQKIFDDAIQFIKGSISESIFKDWFSSLCFNKLTDKEIILDVKNSFALEYIKRNYIDKLTLFFTESASKHGIKELKVLLEVPQKNIPTKPQTPTEKKVVKRSHQQTNLNQQLNFSNFVVGGCNQLAHAVSLRVSETPGQTYNPLFIYGGVGLGKTHLANAIGNACFRRGKKALLVSSEVFVNDLVHSIRNGKMDIFKSKYREIDVLIIDDIQFIQGKERTQEEFFHTFNDLHQRGKQIILTSDKMPQELTDVEERLRTRFSSGISVDLQMPDFETRMAIISKKANLMNIFLPSDVIEFIANYINTSVREIEGAINRVHALSIVHNLPVSIDLAQKALEGIISRKPVTAEEVQNKVSKHFKVLVSDLIGKRRSQNIALARQVSMYLIRKKLSLSFPEIGAIFGGREHSTVIYAINMIEDKISTDEELKRDIRSIEESLI